MTREQVQMLRAFEKKVIEKLDQINKSGAVSDATPDTLRLKYAIALAAEETRPLDDAYRAELANLRHFV